MASDVLIRVDGVAKKFCKSLRGSLWYGVQDIVAELAPWRGIRSPELRAAEFWALRDVSFTVRRGEALGIIGPNGAGKSTLLKLLNGLIKPSAGLITVHGRSGALIELGIGFNPILTGRENIYVNAAVLGLPRRQVDRVVDEIIDFAGIGEFVDAPIQNYSSGMWLRLAYAIAAHLRPDVLLVDEVLAVGDLAFRRKCVQHMLRYLRDGGALVLVSHDLHLLQSVCSRGLLLERGELTFSGPAIEAVNRYLETQEEAAARSTDSFAVTDLGAGNPVVIDKVAISSLNGDEIHTGDDVLISLYYRAMQDVDHVFWAFAIWTGDQTVCITGGVGGLPDGHYRITEGQGCLRCSIPRLALLSGTYTLRAGIADPATRMPIARFGWENPPVFFSVKSEASEIINLHAMTGSLVLVDVQWEGGTAPDTVKPGTRENV